MRKLIITAHPNSQGFTHEIAERFSVVSKERQHSVHLIDLYDPSIRQDFLQLDAINRPTDDPHIASMQKEVSWAEELIFVYPVWWYDAPAILKNWFDVNLANGFAYSYQKSGLLPKQHLR